jgi:hypothetical protein
VAIDAICHFDRSLPRIKLFLRCCSFERSSIPFPFAIIIKPFSEKIL